MFVLVRRIHIGSNVPEFSWENKITQRFVATGGGKNVGYLSPKRCPIIFIDTLESSFGSVSAP